jgi:hypothetical protein
MRVDHRRLHVGVPQQILDGPDVLPRLKQVGCEGMAKAMRGEAHCQTGLADSLLHGPLELLFIEVVPPHMTTTWVCGVVVRREDMLPA